MDGTRRRTLCASLERELAEESARRHFNPRQRLDWLARHLELYVGRFTVLAGRADISLHSLLESDALTAVEAATDAVRAELQSAPTLGPTAADRWRSLEALVADLRQFGDRQLAIELKGAVSAWRAALERSQPERGLTQGAPDAPRISST